jgi:hypothetical protein
MDRFHGNNVAAEGLAGEERRLEVRAMLKLLWLLQGGFLEGYRAQVLGVASGPGGIVNALALWAVGDHPLIALVQALDENWPLIAGGFGLATVAAKIDRAGDKSVQEIADEALGRN